MATRRALVHAALLGAVLSGSGLLSALHHEHAHEEGSSHSPTSCTTCYLLSEASSVCVTMGAEVGPFVLTSGAATQHPTETPPIEQSHNPARPRAPPVPT
jgi:hypothetical protein